MLKNRLILLLILTVACSPKQNQPSITLLPSPSNTGSAEPHLYTGKDGTIFLSWIEKNNENSTLRYSSMKNGQWSAPSVIASGNTWFINWADYPMLATNGSQFLAHFLDKSGNSAYAYDIKLTGSMNQSKTWSAPVVLHDDNKKAEHGFVTILPYENNFFITWLDGRNTVMEGMEGMNHEEGHHGSMSLRAAIVDVSGKKLKEWELDNKTCDCCQTSAAITDSGPVVVYRDRSDEEIRDISIVRLVNGQWTEPKSIHNDHWKIAGCPVNGPRIAADGNRMAVAWFSAGDSTQVKVAFSADAGATFEAPIRMDEGQPIGRVDIELLDDESAMVSWMEGSVIKASRVYRNGERGSAMTIAASSESRSSGFPQMTRSGKEIIFAWTDNKENNIKVASLYY